MASEYPSIGKHLDKFEQRRSEALKQSKNRLSDRSMVADAEMKSAVDEIAGSWKTGGR
jgi:hypothetical protein